MAEYMFDIGDKVTVVSCPKYKDKFIGMKGVCPVNEHISVIDYHGLGNNYFSLYLNRVVEPQNYNEEFYESKYTKVAYDLIAVVKQKMAEGFDEKQINELLNS